MRVALFVGSWDPQINGVVTSVKELQVGLTQMGVESIIITGGDVKEPTQNGNVVLLPRKELKKWNNNFVNYFSKKNIDFISNLGLDIIHSHQENSIGFLASKIAKLNNLPHVITWHTCYQDYKHYILYNAFFVETILEKYCARKYCGKKVQAVITPSTKLSDHLTKDLKIYHKPYIIKTGIHINPNRINRSGALELRDKLGFTQDDFVISYIGRIAKEKNIGFLLEAQIALSSLDEHIKLLIVGDGPYLEKFKKYTDKLGVSDSVVFAGRVEREDLDPYYQASDINVNSSITESQGVTVLEALQNGVPVCCINDSAFDYVIKEGYNGARFSSMQDYIQKILQLKNSNLDEMRKNALRSGNEYNNIRYAKEVLDIYTKCLEQSNKKIH